MAIEQGTLFQGAAKHCLQAERLCAELDLVSPVGFGAAAFVFHWEGKFAFGPFVKLDHVSYAGDTQLHVDKGHRCDGAHPVALLDLWPIRPLVQ